MRQITRIRLTMIKCYLLSLCITAGVVVAQTRAQPAASVRVVVLTEKGRAADLILDDSNRKLLIQSEKGSTEIGYDDVAKAVFEVRTRHRGGAVLVGGLGGALSAAAAAGAVNDYLCILEFKDIEGHTVNTLLEVGKSHAEDSQQMMRASLGTKVEIPVFPEPERVAREYLTRLKLTSKVDVHVDRKNRPSIPEIRTDKALAFFLTLSGLNPFIVHANDQLVAVTNVGAYTYAYLDPGDYTLVSESRARGSARALRVKLEAGKDYYFYQSDIGGNFNQHSRELARLALQDLHYSYWKIK